MCQWINKTEQQKDFNDILIQNGFDEWFKLKKAVINVRGLTNYNYVTE